MIDLQGIDREKVKSNFMETVVAYINVLLQLMDLGKDQKHIRYKLQNAYTVLIIFFYAFDHNIVSCIIIIIQLYIKNIVASSLFRIMILKKCLSWYADT